MSDNTAFGMSVAATGVRMLSHQDRAPRVNASRSIDKRRTSSSTFPQHLPVDALADQPDRTVEVVVFALPLQSVA